MNACLKAAAAITESNKDEESNDVKPAFEQNLRPFLT